MKKEIRNFVVLATLTTATLYGINKIISVTSSMKNLLKTEHGQFFNWKYGNIYYTKTGKGSPVILVHDLNSASSSVEWEKISKYLSKKYTVYTIDLLGCGRSDKPNLTYTNFLYVQLINDFIKNVIQEKASIVATGLSGSFSIMACNMEPELFNKIILINPNRLEKLVETPDKKRNILKFIIDAPIIGTFVYNVLHSNVLLEKAFKEKYYENSIYADGKTLDTYYEAAHLSNSSGKYLFSSITANYTNIGIQHALEKIDHSIYLICSKENADAKDVIDAYCTYNPSIESAYVPHSKYLPQLEAPESLLVQIELFLGSI